MLLNENITIHGDKVILTYHEWMKSPELLELTASEPLTFEEELDMQQLTFILLARPTELPASTTPVVPPSELSKCRMIGDVNLFLPNGPQDDVECEIMIAEADFRRKGLAFEALQLFLTYAIHSDLQIPPANLIARIGSKNTASIALFERLGFKTVKVVSVWDEVEMRWGWDTAAEAVKGTSADWPSALLDGRLGSYEARS
ncbi:N-acetyltransferase 9 [Vanrija pseudolonga]|uniref:N-acetyltransferase 9 n=1 Tax=Vanrija pseudolonga TaxID=143232 RepID=A0AAF1BS07_9TREE|nr:N-acetyltransferase 9 [Vanrija pseudolonga]